MILTWQKSCLNRELVANLRQEVPDQNKETVLTDRELEILRWMAARLSNLEIGKQLFISAGTVKAHSTTIYRKLIVSNRRSYCPCKRQEIYLVNPHG